MKFTQTRQQARFNIGQLNFRPILSQSEVFFFFFGHRDQGQYFIQQTEMWPCGPSVCVTSTIHWAAYEGMLSPSEFFCPASQSPWKASEPQRSDTLKVLTSGPGFLIKETKAFLFHTLLESMYLFCDRFLSLVARCYCILSECSLTRSPHISQLFFCMGDRFRGHINKAAMEMSPLWMFTSIFSSEIQPFHLWTHVPTANNMVNAWFCIPDSPPLPLQPPPLKPMITLDASCVRPWLVVGQLKDKLL